MNVVRYSSNEVMNFLNGTQLRVEGRKYRFNKFLIITDFDEKYKLVYNAFTGAFVSIKNIELENLDVDYPCDYRDFLIEHYFLVPEDFDEEGLLTEYRRRHVIPITPNALDKLNSFTILTTTECNARCFYCYQMSDKNKHNMTEQTARDVVKFIVRSTRPGETIFLGWFGGEPTYNTKVIDIITNGVFAAGRIVNSSMISNGYLLNEELSKKAVDEWRITNIQITLDGTAEIYNKAKKYIYKEDPNPFATVIQNIHHMINAGMFVSIRLNCGVHNVDNLKELISYIAEEFKDHAGHLTVYVHELFDLKENRSDEHKKKIFENMIELENLITKYGFRTNGFNVPESIKTIHCMVDSNDATIISPGGELGLCEHYQNSKFYGHINDPHHKDFDVIRGWREMTTYEEICEDCPFKPVCLKSRQCPDHNICSPYEKDYVLYRTREDMKLIYKQWLQDQINRENDPNYCGNNCNCKKNNNDGINK